MSKISTWCNGMGQMTMMFVCVKKLWVSPGD